ncbi:hypothetical protein V8B97DRAFT_1917398 [Scleroderma yunnanense]
MYASDICSPPITAYRYHRIASDANCIVWIQGHRRNVLFEACSASRVRVSTYPIWSCYYLRLTNVFLLLGGAVSRHYIVRHITTSVPGISQARDEQCHVWVVLLLGDMDAWVQGETLRSNVRIVQDVTVLITGITKLRSFLMKNLVSATVLMIIGRTFVVMKSGFVPRCTMCTEFYYNESGRAIPSQKRRQRGPVQLRNGCVVLPSSLMSPSNELTIGGIPNSTSVLDSTRLLAYYVPSKYLSNAGLQNITRCHKDHRHHHHHVRSSSSSSFVRLTSPVTDVLIVPISTEVRTC